MRYATGLRVTGFLYVVIVFMALPLCVAQGQGFYNLGDANSDGWCNWADVYELSDWLDGRLVPDLCPEGGDANGSGQMNGIDVTFLVSFLVGNGPAPLGSCPCPVAACDPGQSAFVDLLPILDQNPNTATFRVYLMTTTSISLLSFSFQFDPAVVVSFSASSIIPGTDAVLFGPIRPFTAPSSIINVTADFHNAGGVFPQRTAIFDLVLTAVPSAPSSTMSLVPLDPILGPAQCYIWDPVNGVGENSICLLGWTNIAGDANGTGMTNGVDATYLVNYFKGIGPESVQQLSGWLPVRWDF